MRFYPDRPDIAVPVQWYFVPESNGYLPHANVFTSRVWYDNSGQTWPLLGEVDGAPRQWVNGAPPEVMAPFSCQTDPVVWTEGVPYALHDTRPHTSGGVLLCCLGEVPVAVISVTCDDGSITVNPITGDVVLHLNMGHSNEWRARQIFHATDADPLIVEFRGAPTQSGDLVQWNADDGTAWGGISLDGLLFQRQGLQVSRDDGLDLPLTVVDNADGIMFAIGETGEILTNQVTADPQPTLYTGRFPVYDVSGSLLGYVPLFTSPPPPVVIIEDGWSGSDGTLIAGRTPDTVDTPATTYDTVSAVFDLLANEAHVSTTTGNWDTQTIDALVPVVAVEMEIHPAGAGWGLVANAVNEGTGWFGVYIAGFGAIQIYHRVGGAFGAPLASVAFTPTTDPVDCRLSFTGTMVAFTAESTTVSFDMGAPPASTVVGFAFYAAGTTGGLFKVSA